MKKATDVAGHRHDAQGRFAPDDDLVRRVQANGYTPKDIDRVIDTTESPEQAKRLLTRLGREHKKHPPLPPLPPHDGHLDAHDAEVFERAISGQLEPQVIVGDETD